MPGHGRMRHAGEGTAGGKPYQTHTPQLYGRRREQFNLDEGERIRV
jgi:hypothetical protein